MDTDTTTEPTLDDLRAVCSEQDLRLAFAVTPLPERTAVNDLRKLLYPGCVGSTPAT